MNNMTTIHLDFMTAHALATLMVRTHDILPAVNFADIVRAGCANCGVDEFVAELIRVDKYVAALLEDTVREVAKAQADDRRERIAARIRR